ARRQRRAWAVYRLSRRSMLMCSSRRSTSGRLANTVTARNNSVSSNPPGSGLPKTYRPTTSTTVMHISTNKGTPDAIVNNRSNHLPNRSSSTGVLAYYDQSNRKQATAIRLLRLFIERDLLAEVAQRLGLVHAFRLDLLQPKLFD